MGIKIKIRIKIKISAAQPEKILAELGAPFGEEGEAGLQGGKVLPLRGGARRPRGIERAEFGEGGVVGGGEAGAGGFEGAEKRGFFRGEQGAGERTGGGGVLLPKALQRAAGGGELHEKIGEIGGNGRGAGGQVGRFELEQVAEAGGRFAQDGVGRVEGGEVPVATAGVGMVPGGGALKAGAQRLGIEPRTARLGEGGEVIGHAAGVRAVWGARARGIFAPAEMSFADGARSAMDGPSHRMKTPAFCHALAAAALTLALVSCNKPVTDKAVFFGVIHENVHALEKKDVATVMATIHPQSPAFEGTKEAVEVMFKSVDLKYELSELRIVSATPEEVKVSFRQKTVKIGGEAQFQDNIVEGIHTLRPDQGTWKIHKTLQQKITDLQGRPLFAPTAPPPTSPIEPAGKLPPATPPQPAPPAPATPPAP